MTTGQPSQDIAKELANEILKAGANSNQTEADLRFAIQPLLDNALKQYGLDYDVKFERVVYQSKRADALYPSVVIEYKRPGALSKPYVQKQAVHEIVNYLKGLARSETLARKNVGVAIDGRHIIFVRARPSTQTSKTVQVTLDRAAILIEEPEIVGPDPINEYRIEQLLIYLRQLRKRNLTAENLKDDFGSPSPIASEGVALFYERLQQSRSEKVRVLFKEWDLIFGIVYGENLDKAQEDVAELASLYEVRGEPDLKSLLFSIHTYFALIMKMLAAEIISIQFRGLLSSFVDEWNQMSSEQLKAEMETLESGSKFKSLGINNFLEGVFFSWYLQEWDDRVFQFIRRIAKQLSDYEPATPRVDPDQIKDLLKKLYEYLVPSTIRHDLGEFYTPDWLADLLINEIGYDAKPTTRILDPACGSGTFLVTAIRRIVQRAQDYPEQVARTLVKDVLDNVVGFDVNPLAVLAARTNYLIAISDIRKGRDIEIPIYMADSVWLPRFGPFPYGGRGYDVPTSVDVFPFPESLASREIADTVLTMLEEDVTRTGDPGVFVTRVEGFLGRKLEDSVVVDTLRQLFSKVRSLHPDRNRIWSRIIKNKMAPYFAIEQGKFDFVVGNPPWINWQDLSQQYRDATFDLWRRYGLFRKLGGHEARLGGAKRDFSMLFLYACMDRYLKSSGKLGFLITQSVFKTAGMGGRLFRRFKLGETDEARSLKVLGVHDLVDLQPFEEATNRTSMILCQNDAKTNYPVKYYVWRRKQLDDGKKAQIKPRLSLRSVQTITEMEEQSAEPLVKSDPLSPWLTTPRQLLPIVRKVLGNGDYIALEGLNTLGANGVYWVKIIEETTENLLLIENLADVGKRKVPTVREKVEKGLLYPLIRGRDASRWKAGPSCYVFLLQDPKEKRGLAEKTLMEKYSRTHRYISQFRRVLEARRGFKKYFCEPSKNGREFKARAPFWSMYNFAPESLSNWKVVWKYVTSEFTAAVVGPHKDQHVGVKPAIADERLIMISCEGKQEAHYICALLNSSPAVAAIQAYTIGTQMSTHIIKNLRIPKFAGSRRHVRLSVLSERAHQAVAKGRKVTDIEKEIDRLAAEEWNLTSRELSIVQSGMPSRKLLHRSRGSKRPKPIPLSAFTEASQQ